MTKNADTFSIDTGVGAVTPVGSGTKNVSPSDTTTYTGTAKGPGGSVHCATTVTVTPPPPPPAAPTCTLSASPTSVTSGGSSTLTWTTTNADSFAIDNGIGSTTPVTGGTQGISPVATTTYTGTAIGSGGVAHCRAKVAVTTTPPPPPPAAPTCTLSASPTSVNAGDHTTLSWTTTNAASFALDNSIGSTTPVAGGSTTTPAITADTTFTGTAISSSGQVAACTAAVSVNHGGGGGGGGPSCSLTVSPTSYATGGSAALSWGGSGISSVDIDNSIATATSSPGSATVSPTAVGTHTYTGTFHAQNGQTLTCNATLTVTGGGGCTSNCGGGGGGGGSPPPTITLTALSHVSAQPLAYLYLSQIPYTGLDLGPVGTVLYWLVLIGFALTLAYVVLFNVAPFVNRSLRNFGSRVLTVLNAREPAPAEALVAPAAGAESTPPAPPEAVPEAPRGYSPYEGFKSFARDGALSIDDIVKSLSRKHPGMFAERKGEPTPPVEPIFENVEPITVDATAERNTTVPPDVRGFATALIEGDRAAVFAGLRQHIRGAGAPEQLLSAVVCLIDDAYRARIDGTACDPDIARLSARLSTATLEKLVAALATAIDSSYATGATGAKLALTRALAVLGA